MGEREGKRKKERERERERERVREKERERVRVRETEEREARKNTKVRRRQMAVSAEGRCSVLVELKCFLRTGHHYHKTYLSLFIPQNNTEVLTG